MPRVVDPASLRKGFGLAAPETVEPQAQTDLVDTVVSLEAHVDDPQDAHDASAISTTTSKGMFFSNQTQGDLDEIAGIIPIRPPGVGGFHPAVANYGMPDWGQLKMADAGLVARGEVSPPNPTDSLAYDRGVYPYYFVAPGFASGGGTNPFGASFLLPGNDPASDPIFNVDPAGTMDPTYTGGGPGLAHLGGFTRGGLLETARICPIGPGAPVVVSGVVFPADRGVLAFFHWPPGGDVPAFLAQPLTTRVQAALKLGLGLSDGAPDGLCDGAPGGIFEEGEPTYFDFPGRAVGQYDLYEIHSGIDGQTGLPLPDGPLPSAGQVRLGTDPNAGEPPVPGGIPILGGSTLATGGGNDNNFFRYRLPYLSDYETLKYVPFEQLGRYFQKPGVAESNAVDLTQAGNYEAFPADYWTFQVARYRHRFFLLSPPSDQGSYMLMHFRTERDFEKFARDGVLPSDLTEGYRLYSSALADDTNPEAITNIVSGTPSKTALGYHTLRAAVVEDVNTPVLAPVLAYTYARPLNNVMWVSGVQYFVPESVVGGRFHIDTIDTQFTSLFANGYLLGSAGNALQIDAGFTHRDPVFLHLGGFTVTNSNVTNGAGPSFTGALALAQRVVFRYYDLGPYALAAPPTPVDTGDFSLGGGDTPISFLGDTDRCHFSQDARLRVFAAKPLGHQTAATAVTEFVYPRPGGKSVLYHSTRQSPISAVGNYGNFTTGGPLTPPRASLESARKDVEERFLDEVYRYLYLTLHLDDPTFDGNFGTGNITGPGLPFVAAPIERPVRVGSADATIGDNESYLRRHAHELPLNNFLVQSELQVAGLPDRSPPLSDGVQQPAPYSGILMMPKTNYTVGYRPSVVDGDTVSLQPNYTGFVLARRYYVRVFDAAYAADLTPEPDVVGQPLLKFRIDGLTLGDFAYQPPGPGGAQIAILIKIPGLTTWMDLGRRDGEGPSKQDPLADGAGCLVLGPDTVEGRDQSTGGVYTKVLANVGPVASVFANAVLEPGKAPVMVMVVLRAAGLALDFTQGGPNGTTADLRGLTGITLLRHSSGEGPL